MIATAPNTLSMPALLPVGICSCREPPGSSGLGQQGGSGIAQLAASCKTCLGALFVGLGVSLPILPWAAAISATLC